MGAPMPLSVSCSLEKFPVFIDIHTLLCPFNVKDEVGPISCLPKEASVGEFRPKHLCDDYPHAFILDDEKIRQALGHENVTAVAVRRRASSIFSSFMRQETGNEQSKSAEALVGLWIDVEVIIKRSSDIFSFFM
jgi:hypothetical protein